MSSPAPKLRKESIDAVELGPWAAGQPAPEEGRDPLVLGAGDALVIEEGARYVVEVVEPAEIFWTMTSQDGPIEFLD